jgi:hypothetical protein
MAMSAQGTVFKYGATSPSTEVLIKDVPQIMAKRSSLETTDLSCDSRTYIQGLRETAESFDFTANYSATVFGELNELEGVQKCAVIYGDGSGYTWDGYISASINEAAVDAVLEMVVSVTPTTVPIWAAKVSTT